VVFRVTYRGCEAKISGPPESCYPAESAEWETGAIFLYRDLPPDEGKAAMFEATGALFESLENCATIRDRIEEYVTSAEPAWDE
jgi:hypothetical protein